MRKKEKTDLPKKRRSNEKDGVCQTNWHTPFFSKLEIQTTVSTTAQDQQENQQAAIVFTTSAGRLAASISTANAQ